MSGITDIVKQAEKDASQQPAAPALQKAPQTKEELARFEQARMLEQQQQQANILRVQQLSGMIFARLISSDALLQVFSDDKKFDPAQLKEFVNICNIVASQAAVSHATTVWNLQVKNG